MSLWVLFKSIRVKVGRKQMPVTIFRILRTNLKTIHSALCCSVSQFPHKIFWSLWVTKCDWDCTEIFNELFDPEQGCCCLPCSSEWHWDATKLLAQLAVLALLVAYRFTINLWTSFSSKSTNPVGQGRQQMTEKDGPASWGGKEKTQKVQWDSNPPLSMPWWLLWCGNQYGVTGSGASCLGKRMTPFPKYPSWTKGWKISIKRGER